MTSGDIVYVDGMVTLLIFIQKITGVSHSEHSDSICGDTQ